LVSLRFDAGREESLQLDPMLVEDADRGVASVCDLRRGFEQAAQQ
jgi:hypothetical protein